MTDRSGDKEVLVVVGTGGMGLSTARRVGADSRQAYPFVSAQSDPGCGGSECMGATRCSHQLHQPGSHLDRDGTAATEPVRRPHAGDGRQRRRATHRHADDIAAAAEFLLGPAAGFITGVDLLVDGGVIAAIQTGTIDLAAALAER